MNLTDASLTNNYERFSWATTNIIKAPSNEVAQAIQDAADIAAADKLANTQKAGAANNKISKPAAAGKPKGKSAKQQPAKQ